MDVQYIYYEKKCAKVSGCVVHYDYAAKKLRIFS